MTEAERLAKALEKAAAGGCDGTVLNPLPKAAALLRSQAAELEALQKQIANLKTVMVAAAEEIHAHWDAHCDADGYGPQNLMRRLEEGIPSEYGYTAGAFKALREANERFGKRQEWWNDKMFSLEQERDALRTDAEQLRLSLTFIVDRDLTYFDGYVDRHQIGMGAIEQARRVLKSDAAIDAAQPTNPESGMR